MSQELVAARELINLEGTQTGAPYSNAVRYGDLIWTSGALPVDETGNIPESFEEQVKVSLTNLHRSLEAAGADWSSVLKVNGYVSDIQQLPRLNEIYNEIVCQDGKPARTTVEVSSFRGTVQIEFDAVAVRSHRDVAALDEARR